MVIQSMNKKGQFFKNSMFAIVAISMMVIAYAVIIDQQAEAYGTSAQSELAAFNKISSISSTAEGYESSLTPEDQEPGEDPEAGTFRGSYGIITNMFNVFDVIVGDGGMIDSVTTQFGLPSYIRLGLTTFIFIAIALAIVAIIFRQGRVVV